MRSLTVLLATFTGALATTLLPTSTDAYFTVTVTRTFTTCPTELCDTTIPTTWQSSSSDTIVPNSSSTSTSITTTVTSSTVFASGTVATTKSTTSASSTPTTTNLSATTLSPSSTVSASSSTTSSASPTVISPGTSFTPSATLDLADINIDPQVIVKRDPLVDLTVPVTVYIDASTNPNAAVLTTDPLLATSFVIDTQTTLSTTLRSYPYQCGGSDFQGTPGRFYCDDSGAFPQTFRGWVNSPTFTYQNWIFCYTSSDLALYMSNTGPTSNCRQIIFTIDGSTASGST